MTNLIDAELTQETLAINEVHEGDCLELMKRIPDGSVDMILCDLPYGTTACKWDTIIPFDPLWAEYERVIKDNGAIVLTASQPFTSALVLSNPKMFRYEWIWEKQRASNFTCVNSQPLKYHENILIFSKSKHKFFPIKYKVLEISEIEKGIADMGMKFLENIIDNKEIRKFGKVDRRKTVTDSISRKAFIGAEIKRVRKSDGGYRYPKSIIPINKQNNGNVHPTQKPVNLFEYLIKTYTNEGDAVLDNCLGSGTTAVAAINTNRNYIGIEREPEYVEIANQRISDALAAKEVAE